MATKTGKVTQVIGPVIDVDFGEAAALPPIYNALTVRSENGEIVVEVVKHLEPGKIRAISLAPTDGLQRGAEAADTGHMIEVPVGERVLGHIFDVLGSSRRSGKFPASNGSDADTKKFLPIHREAPKFIEQSTATEVFETGIKVIDLMCPFIKGGKVGLFGGAGVGKTVCSKNLSEMSQRSAAASQSSPASANARGKGTISTMNLKNPASSTRPRLSSAR